MDGWVNIARCRIKEGDMQGAEAMLNKAFEIQKTLLPENLTSRKGALLLCPRSRILW